MSEFDIILDNSLQNLKEVPQKLLQMCNLKMLYLQENFIKEIPKDFFIKLPQLSWLDLRSNHISVIPANIAHHKNLENLLLSDNKIQTLPNELGLVPKLKVLQIANNPLSYPNSRIVANGTKAICDYLRQQYQKSCQSDEAPKINNKTVEEQEEEEEREIRVDEMLPMQESLDSSLTIKGLSKVKMQSSGIVHKLSTTFPNKIQIKSYFDDNQVVSTQTSNLSMYREPTLKSQWMDKLKQLLDEQERVLQQERLKNLHTLVQKYKGGTYRNLQALSSWRYQKKIEHERPVRDKPKPPPFATDPGYESMVTREEMQNQIERMIQNTKSPPKKQDLDKLMGDLVTQLKEMEASYGDFNSSKSQIEEEITKIMEMHRKLLNLQQTNSLTLQ